MMIPIMKIEDNLHNYVKGDEVGKTGVIFYIVNQKRTIFELVTPGNLYKCQ